MTTSTPGAAPSVTLDESTSARERAAAEKISSVLAWGFALALVLAGGVVILYVRTFGTTISTSHGVWNEAGGFFGGVLGPIFGLLSLFALLLTVMMQREQLGLSRQQLAESGAELARAREIQLTMASAMNEQARYATISARAAALGAALSVVTKIMRDLDDIVKTGEPSDVSHHAQYLAASRREAELSEEILKLTDQLRI